MKPGDTTGPPPERSPDFLFRVVFLKVFGLAFKEDSQQVVV
jgi:hypothetical protein